MLERKVSVQLARKPETAAEKAENAASGGEAGSGAEGGRRRNSGRGRGRGRGRAGRGGRGGRAVSYPCILIGIHVAHCADSIRLPTKLATLRALPSPRLPMEPTPLLRALLNPSPVLLVSSKLPDNAGPQKTASHQRTRSWLPTSPTTLAKTRYVRYYIVSLLPRLLTKSSAAQGAFPSLQPVCRQDCPSPHPSLHGEEAPSTWRAP